MSEKDGLSSGVGSDLQQATRVADSMVRHYGMTASLGQVALGDDQMRDGPLAMSVVKAKEQVVAQQLAKARAILEKNRAVMDVLVEKLMEKNRLTREDLERILPE